MKTPEQGLHDYNFPGAPGITPRRETEDNVRACVEQIRAVLDGQRWDTDRIDVIVRILRKHGYVVRERVIL